MRYLVTKPFPKAICDKIVLQMLPNHSLVSSRVGLATRRVYLCDNTNWVLSSGAFWHRHIPKHSAVFLSNSPKIMYPYFLLQSSILCGLLSCE